MRAIAINKEVRKVPIKINVYNIKKENIRGARIGFGKLYIGPDDSHIEDREEKSNQRFVIPFNILTGKNGLFVNWVKIKDKNDEWVEIAGPSNSNTRNKMNELIIDAFKGMNTETPEKHVEEDNDSWI